jgi:hypothetical protein
LTDAQALQPSTRRLRKSLLAFLALFLTGPTIAWAVMFLWGLRTPVPEPAPGAMADFISILVALSLPYAIWVAYFHFRTMSKAPIGAGTHIRLLLVTPFLWIFLCFPVFAVSDAITGLPPDEPFWVLVMPFIYVWNLAQYGMGLLLTRQD